MSIIICQRIPLNILKSNLNVPIRDHAGAFFRRSKKKVHFMIRNRMHFLKP